MTVSKGNAEQPSAQTPKGPASPNRLETVVQARQEPGVQNRSQSGPPQNRPQPGQPGNQQPRSPQGPIKGDAKLASPGGGSPQPRPQQPNAERRPDGVAVSHAQHAGAMAHGVHTEFVERDLLHLAIGRVVVDPVLVAT